MQYPVRMRSKLRRWEWYVLLYWQANYAQIDSTKVAYVQRLAKEYSGKWVQEKITWMPLTKKELNHWRWKLLVAKCGISTAFEVSKLPIALQLMLTLRPLDEPLSVAGRSLKSFPACGTSFAFSC